MPLSLKNKTVLITCGPTWVPIDDMRVISNQSTGALGHILVKKLIDEGAKVTLIEGPVKKPIEDKKVKIIKYCFYDELASELKKALKNKFDIVIHAAAVSDYKVKKPSLKKLSSGKKEISIKLTPTEKLIDKIKKISKKSLLVGFKLESFTSKAMLKKKADNLFNNANCDLVVANSLKNGYTGYVVNPDGKILGGPSKTKQSLCTSLVKALKVIA